VQTYGAQMHFGHNLTAVDGAARKATFRNVGTGEEHVQAFDLLHVCPPQTAPDFVRESELADAAGWIDVDPASLRHARFDNIFALGDAISAPNAKTAAAVRKQAPVVAENLCRSLAGNASLVAYDGYGSCPLTVERGKVVLAEFGYGGRLQPTVPKWLNDGTRPTRAGWLLKAKLLPPIYYDLMLKGREWLAAPANH
jgi:sulfide:quinone oxidoreductase